ncbi:hypothetical protein [Flavobacterium sp.]|uniref:hypothetical protein n=1 Tax=Flavobacterium sp. TaxID=239 RepID=UPI0037538E86
MILIVFKYLTPRGFRGLTFYPFVFLKHREDKDNLVFLNHEKIHIRQQLELLILPFYVWYFIEYIFRLMQYKDRKKAYYNISFEREAYSNEKDLNYIQKRTFWSFQKYIN